MQITRKAALVLGSSLVAAPLLARADAPTLWIATPTWANENKSTVRSFAKSLVEGTQWSLGNSERAVALLSDWTKTKVDRLRQPMALTLDPAMLQPLLDAGLKYKLLAHPLVAADLIWKG